MLVDSEVRQKKTSVVFRTKRDFVKIFRNECISFLFSADEFDGTDDLKDRRVKHASVW